MAWCLFLCPLFFLFMAYPVTFNALPNIKESNNILASLFLFPNYCLRILFGSFKLIFPFYLINNLLGLVVEKVSDFYRNKKGFIGEYWEYALTSMPMGYSLIIKIKK